MDLSVIDWSDIWIATWETLVMTGVSLLFTILLGLPLGILLFVTARRQLLEQGFVYTVLSFVVNVLRSVPFLILLIVMIPVTVILIGTSLGVEGAIPPLVVGTAPFFARLVENVLREVDRGVSGVIGGGGLGDLAIRFGYQRFQTEVMVITVALLVVLVQIIQYSGDRLVLYFTRK